MRIALRTFQCDLNRLFGGLTSTVPDGLADQDEYMFHEHVLPIPPASLGTDRIVIRKSEHHYNSCYRADALWMYLSPRTCREFGVFLLACGFHGPKETTTLSLNHPESDIRRITISPASITLDDLPSGLSMKPFALLY